MQIVGTIVNKNMQLAGLLLKGKPSELGYLGSKYLMKPFEISEVKSLIHKGIINDYKINDKGNIEGINKKLSNLPMYDSKGNFLDKRMEIRSVIEDDGSLIGAVVFFFVTGKEKKVKLNDLSLLYEYFEPTNFGLRCRDNNYYITGKGNTKKEDIPVIEKNSIISSEGKKVSSHQLKKEKESPKTKKNTSYVPFYITSENRHLIGFKDIENEKLVIPKRFNDTKYKYEVIGIDEKAFEDCKNLISVVIPNSVVSIGNYAFMGCSALTSIDIPNSVTRIGTGVFSYCISLTSIELPNSLTSIPCELFWDCSGLTSVVIPKTVTSIGYYAFKGCSGLTSIDIPNSVTSIEEGAFLDCTGFTSFNIPKNIIGIDDLTFEGCTGLTSIIIPNNITAIAYGAFKDCSGLTSVIIPNSVKSIGNYAFQNCINLMSVDLPDSITEMGKDAFVGSPCLESLVIPKNVNHTDGYWLKE